VSAQRDQYLGHREVLAAAQVTHGLDAERGRQVLGVPGARRFRGNVPGYVRRRELYQELGRHPPSEWGGRRAPSPGLLHRSIISGNVSP
jgi:hypothetical protein